MALDRAKVTKLGDELQKAAGLPSTPPTALLKMLGDINAAVPTASDDILRTTKIGMTVNRVKGLSKDPEVQKRANEIVAKWRKEIAAQKGDGGKSPAAAAAAQKAGTPSRTSTPAAQSQAAASAPSPAAAAAAAATTKSNGAEKAREEEKLKLPADLDKRTWKTDGVSLKQTGDTARDGCATLIYDGLAFRSTESPSRLLPLAFAIESTAFKELCPDGNATAAYKAKMRSLFQNLKNRESSHLRANVTNGKIGPERLVGMSADEMKSDKQRAEDEKLEKENMDKAMVAQEEKSVSTGLQCGKCKGRKTSYTQAQTRSADEPMTTFCECLVCGHRWKFS